MRVRQWIVALVTLVFARVSRRFRRRGDQPGQAPSGTPQEPAGAASYTPAASAEDAQRADGRIVPEGSTSRRAENAVLALLGLASLFALGFVVVYAEWAAPREPVELLGICLAGALLCIGGALAVVAKKLVVTEELEDEYPPEHPQQDEEIAAIVRQSGSRITRKKLLAGAGVATGGALGLAAVTPVLSLGPFLDTGPLDKAPWRRGTRLVDENDKPYTAGDIERGTFYTAFPEAADKELIGASIVVVRVDPAMLKLPADRQGWAPGGIVAYSKICTHAGCAIALYRKPTFAPVEPKPALVCPCHYSTFDPMTGGTVTYGPAGRPLPQLPLLVDGQGYLRAAGNFSERPGPSWWNVRQPPRT